LLIGVVDATSVFGIVLKNINKIKQKTKSFAYGGIVSLTVSSVF
jgi:hypothetical protein